MMNEEKEGMKEKREKSIEEHEEEEKDILLKITFGREALFILSFG
jgi:hypothetical protein